MEVSSGIPELTVNEMKELVSELYNIGHRQSVLLIGAPGIGKSEGVQQLAQELAKSQGKTFVELKFRWEGGVIKNYSAIFRKAVEILKNPDDYFVLIDLRLTEYEPYDLNGVPRDFDIEDLKAFDYVPFIWQLVASACSGILFLDEITNVQRQDVRATMYKLLRDRKAGWIAFHPDLLVISAGNRPEDATIATLLDAPVVNRVLMLRIKAPTVDEWAGYMDKYIGDWDRRVYAFLKRFPEFLFQQPEDSETLNPFPTPRSWTELAKISHKISNKYLDHVAYGEVGLEASTHFVTFVRTEVPDVDKILINPEVIAMYDVDARYLIASQLAHKIQEECANSKKPNLQKFVKVLTWLLKHDREMLQLTAVMAGSKAMRKLHAYSLTMPQLRQVASFFAETWKIMQEAGF